MPAWAGIAPFELGLLSSIEYEGVTLDAAHSNIGPSFLAEIIWQETEIHVLVGQSCRDSIGMTS